MTTVIEASNEADAEYKLRGKIKIWSVILEETHKGSDDTFENLLNIFGMKK
jgi:hypothetical protein